MGVTMNSRRERTVTALRRELNLWNRDLIDDAILLEVAEGTLTRIKRLIWGWRQKISVA